MISILIILAIGCAALSGVMLSLNARQRNKDLEEEFKQHTAVPFAAEVMEKMGERIVQLEAQNAELNKRLKNVETIITDEQFQIRLPSAEDDLDRKIEDLMKQKEYLRKLKG